MPKFKGSLGQLLGEATGSQKFGIGIASPQGGKFVGVSKKLLGNAE
ncbi:hypothetical protein REC12_03740 [Desulfosporosinus sp. PR]|nr:hypothetical protein [Desulfosporosinus sp. PR]